MSKQYFVGIGAQKAGTTWLGEYLDRHPQVGFSPVKELHYFDAIFLEKLCGFFNDDFRTQLRETLCDRKNDLSDPGLIRYLRYLCLRLEMNANPHRYNDYFDLLAEAGHRVFGEITPSYSMLAENGFRAILERYPDAKFIFILRDPVDRYWSNLRFYETLYGTEAFNAREQILPGLSNPDYYLRTDYRRTLTELYKAVPMDRVCVVFYERLMNTDAHEGELGKITAFLGIDYIEGDLGNRVNMSKNMDIDRDNAIEIARKFSHVYDYVMQLPGMTLPDNWSRNMALVKRNSESLRSR